MLIEFDKISESILTSFKGGEKELRTHMFHDEKNKIMKGRLIPGASIGMHTHETNSEIIFIISGSGKVLFDDTEEKLSAGSCHYCPMGHTHSLINDSQHDLEFYAVIPEHK